MPLYIYEGPGTGISIAGRSLDRGLPTLLEGRAALAAEGHPLVTRFRARPAMPEPRPATAAEEAGVRATVAAEAKAEAKPVTLERMNLTQLQALAAERGIEVADDATKAQIRTALEVQTS